MDNRAHEQTIAAKLLDWYRSHARSLPWRAPPDTGQTVALPDPYRVWLSEIMLQQTTTAAVAPYFARFTARWPTLGALAAAPAEEVMAEWAGLGYYSRARNLVACAAAAQALGGLPDTEEELRRLPGLGTYTAAAIAAIAFGKRAVVVDANVERVAARLFCIDQPLPAARKAIRAAVDNITPDTRSGDFAQAMMDVGATICTPKIPRCLLCPLAQDCRARELGRQEELPVKPPKKARPQRTGTAFWIERDGCVLLVTRPATGMLGAMRALPDDGWSAQGNGTGAVPFAGEWQMLGSVRHVFTHCTLDLRVMRWGAALGKATGVADGEWVPLAQIERAGLPTLFAKAATLALAARD